MTKTASITDIIRPVIQPKYTGKSVSYLDFLSNSPDFFLRNNPKLSEVKLKEISEKQSAIQSGEWALEMALGHPSFFQFFQQFSQSNSLDTILYYDIYDHCPMAVPISQAWAMGMWASPGPCPGCRCSKFVQNSGSQMLMLRFKTASAHDLHLSAAI